VQGVLRKLVAVRAMMRAHQLGQPADGGLPTAAQAPPADLEDLFRLLAIAKYEERYVIPPAHTEDAGRLMAQHEQLFSQCSLDSDGGPGMGGQGPPASVASFHPGGQPRGQTFRDRDGRVRFNLLGWDGHGEAPHLFPEGGPS